MEYKSGLDKKFDISFHVNAYEADLLILLFHLMDQEIAYEETSNIESFDILISELWHQIPLIEEYIKNGIGVEVTGRLQDIAGFIRNWEKEHG